MSNRHKTFGSFESEAGAVASAAAWPVRSGPRHCGQSAASRLQVLARRRLARVNGNELMMGWVTLRGAGNLEWQRSATVPVAATSKSSAIPGLLCAVGVRLLLRPGT